MAFVRSDVARLVHHYLLKEGYVNTANCMVNECAHLKGLKSVKSPVNLPRLLGPSLVEIFEYYLDKDCIGKYLAFSFISIFQCCNILFYFVGTESAGCQYEQTASRTHGLECPPNSVSTSGSIGKSGTYGSIGKYLSFYL